MMTAEQIKEKTAMEDFNKMIECVYTDRFEGFFEYTSSKSNNFEDIFNAYIVCRDALTDNLTENLYFFSSGCTFEAYNLTTEDGTPITEKSKRDDVFNALNKDFEDRQQKLDLIFFRYAKKIDSGEKIDSSEMLKEMSKTLNEINTKITKPQKMQWILDAIKDGQLEKDGKTLRVTPEKMAFWLNEHVEEDVTTDFMYNNFRIRMARSTAQQAASRGKPEYLKKKKK